MLVLILFALAVALAIRASHVLLQIRKQQCQGNINTRRRTTPISTLVVLGSGGHTTEMLHLLKNLNAQQYQPLVFIVATTDTTSLRRVEAFGGRQPDKVYRIPRSREVGQSYISSIGTTLWSFIFAFQLVFWEIRPGLLLCNGPGTCLPIAVVTFLCRLLGLCEGQIVFVESFCRVTSLSLTGKLLYPVVDLFVVHWEQLQAKFPRSRLVTTFVPRSSKSPTARS